MLLSSPGESKGRILIPSDPRVPKRVPEGPPRCPKGLQKTPKKHPKEHPKTHKGSNKINTLSKLGFVHRRSVLEPPKPKVDYLYYTLGTLKSLMFTKKT